MRQELSLGDDRTIAVVTRRDGGFDVAVDAGDGAGVSVRLDEDEADAVAELLGSPKLVSRMAQMQREADDVLVEQLSIPRHSPFAGRALGDTRAQSRTHASIVAVMRGGSTQASPGPDFMLEAGDLVVAVGTREGLDQIAHILDGTG